jgi:hypothetical protein
VASYLALPRPFPASLSHPQNLALLVGIVWLVIAAQLLVQHWAASGQLLGDSDDAMRLVEVRRFLAGQGWFDLHEPRVQPPIGYDTHWSRLIDAGLAGLFVVFHGIVEAAQAERLMRVTWPLLWLIPAIAGAAAIALRLAGRQAASAALLLLAVGLPAFQQFKPGRIDHHNVQIALTMLIVAATVWSDRLRWTAWAAGALSGLALAIGLESAPFVVIAGAAFAARYVLDRNGVSALAAYGASLAASAAVAFFVSVGPANWLTSACDAIAINAALPLVIAGSIFAAAGSCVPRERAAARCCVAIGAASLAILASLWLEPRCAAGPFATIDPALWPVWHSHVREMQSLAATARDYPAAAAAIAAYPAAAILAAVALAFDANTRRDLGFVAAAAAFALAAAMTVVAIRSSSYAIWLGLPLVAAAIVQLFARFRLDSLPLRCAVTIALAPAVVAGGAIAIAEAAGEPALRERPNLGCFKSENYAAIGRLPAGLVAADVDYGPFLLALTPHAVLAAPYHRLSAGILSSHRVFARPPDAAREIVRAARVTYVMLCGDRPPQGLAEPDRRRSLWSHLQAGSIPDWLEAEPISGVLRVYRVRQ